MADAGDRLLDAVRSARTAGQAVTILGSGSKRFLLGETSTAADARILSVEEHTGIVDYRPEELVVTVRAGTRLKELRQTLAREGQMLAFEPPEFHGLGTIGGAVASGLAGPGRPWRGGVRDSVLGVVVINGLGERLRFGGQVMKNVAGFDLFRLQAGAFGIFGVLLDVSLKVLPMPSVEETRVLELDREAAARQMRAFRLEPGPVSATAWLDGRLHVRLSGAEAAVRAASRTLGGERAPGEGLWGQLRDHALPFFREAPVACRHVAPAADWAAEDGLIEWNGARRWAHVSSLDQNSPVRESAWCPFAAGYANRRCAQPDSVGPLADYQRRLKSAFDPDWLFNREIFGADLAA